MSSAYYFIHKKCKKFTYTYTYATAYVQEKNYLKYYCTSGITCGTMVWTRGDESRTKSRLTR